MAQAQPQDFSDRASVCSTCPIPTESPSSRSSGLAMGHLLARGYVVSSHPGGWKAGGLRHALRLWLLRRPSSLAASNGGGPRISIVSGWCLAAALRGSKSGGLPASASPVDGTLASL